MKRIVPALVAALLLTPAVVPAQSLGEAAARDKEKKEKDKAPPMPGGGGMGGMY